MGVTKSQLAQVRKLIKRRERTRRSLRSKTVAKVIRPKYFQPHKAIAETFTQADMARAMSLMDELGVRFTLAKKMVLARKSAKP